MQDKSEFSQKEEEILKFWKENKIFEKSVEQAQDKPFFSFYDGPPFLSGKPHHGHILATAIKDTVVRYKTMKGFNVPRRVGWDCHGLPVENLIEKELNIKTKKEIEEKIGIEKFNKACKDSVFSSKNIFEKTLARVGRWSDYFDAYMTLDNSYVESVWWVFKQLWDRELIYKDYRVTPYCPRCGTPLSNFEVNQGYKDVYDPSIYIKFKLTSDVDEKTSDVENTYFLAWTTTPWTLTANVALAINPSIKYKVLSIKGNNDKYIIASARVEEVFKEKDYEMIKEIIGKDLLSIEYEPLYEFIKPEKKAHFVVAGDFVSTEDGTGIVHIASAFGADDMNIGKENHLPVIITVDEEGRFKKEIKQWAGMFVKDADKEIIKDLDLRNLLFKSERITHTYPFCWRCDSPLLYYPLETWYISVEKLKDKLVANNKKINWVPEHIKEGRFGKWLEGSRDWAFSRNRYWGAPVPIWQCDKCKETKVAGSVEELKQGLGDFNKLFLIRHAEAENNVAGIVNSWPEIKKYSLTDMGKEQAKKIAQELKKEKIEVIYSSPLARAQETSEIIAKELNLKIITDEKLREIGCGEFNGKKYKDFDEAFPDKELRAEKADFGVETGRQIRNRLETFLKEINEKHKDKNIIVVSHGDPLQIFYGITHGLDLSNSLKSWYPKKGSIKEVLSRPIDLHRPFIDEIKIKCTCGGEMKRVEEVFDCWFESGAMPYAQYHYPFENEKLVEETFPADFIAEGLDQTRGWFYTLHVLATALTQKDIGLGKDQPAFKNVVVNGLILDSKGRKLSKKLRNYTEPEEIMEKFGADALRFYLLSSTAIGGDYLFDDKGVRESMRKITANLYNSVNFLKTYANLENRELKVESSNVLDQWIVARLQKSVNEVIESMDKYNLTRASRVFIELLDDLSNWYIRRSRSRFQHNEDKKDYESAVNVLRYILIETSKLIAPFMPFVAEKVYQELGGEKKSVHLDEYPESRKLNTESNKILEEMKEIRNIVAMALEQRAKAGIKVRQPLAVIKIRNPKSEIRNNIQLQNLIKEETNIKEIRFDEKISNEVELDIEITDELKQEGIARELMRNIQDLRKKSGLKPQDKIEISIETNKDGEEIIKKFESEIKNSTNTNSIKFSVNNGEELKINELMFKIEIKT